MKEKIIINRALWVGLTIKCNWNCEYCCNAAIDSQTFTTLKTIKDLIRFTEEAGYVYPFVELNGGEALLHPDFEEIMVSFSKSSSFEFIEVRTNGTPPVSDRALKHMDRFYITWYGDHNIEAIKEKQAQGERVGTQVRVSDNRDDPDYKWIVYPQKPLPPYDFEVEPVEFNKCCPGIVIWGNRIYYCAGVYFYKNHVHEEFSTNKWTTVRPNYLEDLKGVLTDANDTIIDADQKIDAGAGRCNVKQHDMCKICRNNRNIHRNLEGIQWRLGARAMKAFDDPDLFIDLDKC